MTPGGISFARKPHPDAHAVEPCHDGERRRRPADDVKFAPSVIPRGGIAPGHHRASGATASAVNGPAQIVSAAGIVRTGMSRTAGWWVIAVASEGPDAPSGNTSRSGLWRSN